MKELFFLKKKPRRAAQQKNFWSASRGVGTIAGQQGAKRRKSFLVSPAGRLFFKKERLSFCVAKDGLLRLARNDAGGFGRV
jgi:hypothetical protein